MRQVLLGRVPRLGVDDAVGGQVERPLARDPVQAVRGLHHRDGVVERLQVPHQRAGVGRLDEPAPELVRRRWPAARGPTASASSTIVAGRSPPSRWSCSETFGARATCSRVGVLMPVTLVGRRRSGRSRGAAGRAASPRARSTNAPSSASRRPARTARGCRCAASSAARRPARARPAWRAARRRRPACTGSSLRARPAPSRHAATPTASASSCVEHAVGRRQHLLLSPCATGSVGVRVAALGADHRASTRPSPDPSREPVGRVDVVDACGGEHLARQRQGELDDVRRVRRRRAPRPTRAPRARCRR